MSLEPLLMSPPGPPSEDAYIAAINLSATTFVSGVSFGVMSCLYSVCMYSLIRRFCSTKDTRKTSMFAVWVTLLWLFSSISTIANAWCTISAYIYQSNYPGGPDAYLGDEWNKPVPVLAYTTYLLTMWLADALMLWRLVVFYSDVHPWIRRPVISFAVLTYIGTVGSACFTLAILGTNESVYSNDAMRATIPCFTLSVTLNVFTTVAIAIRLLRFKKLVEDVLGHEEALGSPYANIVMTLTESSALYTIWSLVFIILYLVNNPVQNVLLATLCNVQVIAPVLIVYRASSGMSVDQATAAKLHSRMVFADSETRPSMWNTPRNSGRYQP